MKKVGKTRTRTRLGSLLLFFLMLLSLVVFMDMPQATADELPTISVVSGVPASGQAEGHGPIKGIFQWTYDGRVFSLVSLNGEYAEYGLSESDFADQLMRNEIAYFTITSATYADIPDYDDVSRDVDDPGYRPEDREIWEPDEDPTDIDEDDIVWGDPETQFAVMHVYDAGGNLNPDQFQMLASPQLLPSQYQANSIVNTDYFAMPIPGYIYDPALPGNGFIQLSADMPYLFVFYVPETSVTGPMPPQPPPPPATQTGDPGFTAPKPPPKPQGPAIDQLPAGSAPPSPQGVETDGIMDWWEEEGGEQGESRRPRPGDKDDPTQKDEPKDGTDKGIPYGFVNVLFIDDATGDLVASLYIEAFVGDFFSQAMLWGWRGMINIGPEWEIIPEKSTPGIHFIEGENEDEYIYMRQRDPNEDPNRMVEFYYYLLYPDNSVELKGVVNAPKPLKSQYTLAEAEALFPLPPGFVYSPSPYPNPDIFGPIPPEMSLAQFPVYFEYEDPSCVDKGDCPDFDITEMDTEVVVRHFIESGNSYLLMEWTSFQAKLGAKFTLDELKNDYTAQGIYVKPVPPNKAVYSVNHHPEVFDIYYYQVDDAIPPETPEAPPGIKFPPEDCTPTPDCHECWDPPRKTIKVPTPDKPWQRA